MDFGSAEVEVVGRAFSDNRNQPSKVVTEDLSAMEELNVLSIAVDVAGRPAGEAGVAVEAVDTAAEIAAAADGWD